MKAFTAHSRNREFFLVYPSFGRIRSMLAAKNLGPEPRCPIRNSIPLSSHLPVHRAIAHSSVKSKGKFFIKALRLAASKGPFHG